MSMSLNDFQDLVGEKFQQFYSASELVGGLVSEQAQHVKKAFDWQLSLLTTASQAKKPSTADFQELLKPLAELVTKIQGLRDSNRRNEQFEHLSAVGEGIAAFSWVAVQPAPAPFIKEMADTSQFWINKVLVAFKTKDPNHVSWGKAWIEFLQELQVFVRKHHTTGLVWNPNGGDAKAISGSAPAAPPAGIPGPPPPPPPEFFDDKPVVATSGDDSRAALFSSINKGSDITSGLRKVTADQMTHKNPSLRTTSVVADKASAQQNGTAAKPAVAVKKPPKFELEGRKWVIEHQEGNNELVINDVEMSQTVMVHKCKNSFLKVEGKVNTICLDQCENFSIVIDSLLSSLDILHCKKINVQIMGAVPTMTIAKVNNIQVYLSKDSLACQLISSESTGMNVSVPGPDDEYVEHPIPEQYMTVWNGKGFDTTPTENI